MIGRPSVAGIGGGALLALYPIAVWLGIRAAGDRMVSLGVLGLLAVLIPLQVVRAQRLPHLRALLGPYLALVALAILAAVARDQRFLLALPVLVNAGLLASFAGSLAPGRMPIVETFARAVDGAELPPEKVRYCRWVTVVWCVFFLLNGLTALWLATAGPLHLWALYTGFVSYLLMAALFGGEYAVRRIRFG